MPEFGADFPDGAREPGRGGAHPSGQRVLNHQTVLLTLCVQLRCADEALTQLQMPAQIKAAKSTQRRSSYMNAPKSKTRAKAATRKVSAGPQRADQEVTEAMVLELFARHPLSRYNTTQVARQLGCCTERSMTLLRALTKRCAVQVNSSPIGEPLFGARMQSQDSGLQRIRERGDLRFDHNGALRHWELSMASRRS